MLCLPCAEVAGCGRTATAYRPGGAAVQPNALLQPSWHISQFKRMAAGWRLLPLPAVAAAEEVEGWQKGAERMLLQNERAIVTKVQQ